MDFGKFYTSAGAELTETHLNWNYSRSLIYANGLKRKKPRPQGRGFLLLLIAFLSTERSCKRQSSCRKNQCHLLGGAPARQVRR